MRGDVLAWSDLRWREARRRGNCLGRGRHRRRAHQTLPETANTATSSLVYVDVVGLIKGEQHGLGIAAELLKYLIERSETCGEPGIAEPRMADDVTDIERIQRDGLMLPIGSCASSRKTRVVARSSRVNSNICKASSAVQAASSAEWPGGDSWCAPVNARRVAAISFSIHWRTASGADLSWSAENVKLVMRFSPRVR